MVSLSGLSQTWNLEPFFPGGSGSPAFAAFLERLQSDVASLMDRASATAAPASAADAGPWIDLVEAMQALMARQREAGAFISCLTAQDVKDEQALVLQGTLRSVSAALASAATVVDSQMVSIPDGTWAEILKLERLTEIAVPLEERRRRGRERFAPEVEALVNDLSVDGYHGWSNLYDKVSGRLTATVEENGRTRTLSVPQLANRVRHPDRSVRAEAFAKWEETWSGAADLCATALNHLGGYRLALYKHRGWEQILREPVEINRMQPETLDAMWDTITRNKPHLVRFMERKAKLMGLERLAWHDVPAPITSHVKRIEYDGAANFIVEQFGKFSPDLAAFADQAFRERWIEAEDRSGKRAGGFCTTYPLSRESRIFMTFSGTSGNVATLAHELGHAYHNWVMRDMATMARSYASNVAETASTFAELIMADAALKAATTREEKVALLADKVERAISFMMDIHARFLFETRFYEARKKGMLSVPRLNELMVAAQRDAFQDSLSGYHPHFWASKLHFYITYNPFYNWPYTFGYLFSNGVYARAGSEGPGFAARYDALLRDTGRMRVEELASRHLGVDLTRPEFWQSAIDLIIADTEEFLALTQ